MKIFSATCIVLSGLLVFLATIDLAPYLTPHSPEGQEFSASPREEVPAATPEETVSPDPFPSLSTDAAEKLAESDLSETKGGQPPAPSGTETEEPAKPVQESTEPGNDPEEIPAPLIELEVTVLPPADYPYSILLESVLDQKIARQAAAVYQERGIPAHWVKVDLGAKGIQYRLFAGIFQTMEEGREYLDHHRLVDRLIKPTVYSARVGIFTDKGQLAADYITTRDAGVFPYVLATDSGDYFLYVGSFYTLIGATDQCRQLRSSGLNCEPVKRTTLLP